MSKVTMSLTVCMVAVSAYAYYIWANWAWPQRTEIYKGPPVFLDIEDNDDTRLEYIWLELDKISDDPFH